MANHQRFRVENGKIIHEDDNTFRERHRKALDGVSLPPVIYTCRICRICLGIDDASVLKHWRAVHKNANKEKISEKRDTSNENAGNSAENLFKYSGNEDSSCDGSLFPTRAKEQEPANNVNKLTEDVIKIEQEEMELERSPRSVDSGFSCRMEDETNSLDYKYSITTPPYEDEVVENCTGYSLDLPQRNENQPMLPILQIGDTLETSPTSENASFDEYIMPTLTAQMFSPCHDERTMPILTAQMYSPCHDPDYEDEAEEITEVENEDEDTESNSSCGSSSPHQVSEDESAVWDSQKDQEYLSKLKLPNRRRVHVKNNKNIIKYLSLYEAMKQGRKLWWCKLCDDYQLSPEQLKLHMEIAHLEDCSKVNRYNYATWDLEIAKTFNSPSEIDLDVDSN